MKPKIAHISTFDSNYIDKYYKIFEKLKDEYDSDFFYPYEETTNQIKYAKLQKVSIVDFLSTEFSNLLKKYSFVVHYGMTELSSTIVELNPTLKHVWIGFGFDYYDVIYEDEKQMYFEQTRKIAEYIEELNKQRLSSNSKATKEAYFILTKKPDKKEIFRIVKFFCPAGPGEVENLLNKIGYPFPQGIGWPVNSANEYELYFKLENFMKNISETNDILLGNNAYPTNNHVEMLDFLYKIDFAEKIICPLSYGNPIYANLVKNYGEKIFRDRFVALTQYLPEEEYFKTVLPCSNVIMYQLRQQALKNINAMLFLGKKVFISENNPIYKPYTETIGFKIFSIEELFKNPNLLYEKLSEEDKKRNKEIILEKIRKEDPINMIRQSIKTILDSK